MKALRVEIFCLLCQIITEAHSAVEFIDVPKFVSLAITKYRIKVTVRNKMMIQTNIDYVFLASVSESSKIQRFLSPLQLFPYLSGIRFHGGRIEMENLSHSSLEFFC